MEMAVKEYYETVLMLFPEGEHDDGEDGIVRCTVCDGGGLCRDAAECLADDIQLALVTRLSKPPTMNELLCWLHVQGYTTDNDTVGGLAQLWAAERLHVLAGDMVTVDMGRTTEQGVVKCYHTYEGGAGGYYCIGVGDTDVLAERVEFTLVVDDWRAVQDRGHEEYKLVVRHGDEGVMA